MINETRQNLKEKKKVETYKKERRNLIATSISRKNQQNLKEKNQKINC